MFNAIFDEEMAVPPLALTTRMLYVIIYFIFWYRKIINIISISWLDNNILSSWLWLVNLLAFWVVYLLPLMNSFQWVLHNFLHYAFKFWICSDDCGFVFTREYVWVIVDIWITILYCVVYISWIKGLSGLSTNTRIRLYSVYKQGAKYIM